MQSSSTPILTKELRTKIRNARVRLGLSQEELACILGVTRSAIKNWETGRTTRCRPKSYCQVELFVKGELDTECHLHKQILVLRHLLNCHTPPELQQTFVGALKAAEHRAGGLDELLASLQVFLHKVGNTNITSP